MKKITLFIPLLFITTWNLFSQNSKVPVEMMQNTIPALKKDGALIIIERDPVKTGQTGRSNYNGGSCQKPCNGC